jgi:O-antigen/teichoic acid export membrane protein
MGALALSEGGARLISFAYYLFAARVLAPEEFGVLRYTITLAVLAFGTIQVLASAIARELGAARSDTERVAAIIGSGIAIAIGLWIVSVLLCAAAAIGGLLGSADSVGLVTVLTGIGVFQVYYGIARGLGNIQRMAVTYVGGSLIQLASILALALTANPGPTVALVIFGVSSAAAVFLAEVRQPLVRKKALHFSRTESRALWRLGRPLLAAQLFYLVWISADQIWVERQLGERELGIYSAAKNLAQLYVVIPAGAYGVLLPRVAELRAAGEDARAARLIIRVTMAVIGLSFVLAIPVVIFREPLLTGLYGDAYSPAAPALVGLSAGMVVYAGFVTVTSAAVGWGHPRIYSWAMTLAALVNVVALSLYSGRQASGAAWILAISITIGFAAVLLRTVIRPWSREPNPDDAG